MLLVDKTEEELFRDCICVSWNYNRVMRVLVTRSLSSGRCNACSQADVNMDFANIISNFAIYDIFERITLNRKESMYGFINL